MRGLEKLPEGAVVLKSAAVQLVAFLMAVLPMTAGRDTAASYADEDVGEPSWFRKDHGVVSDDYPLPAQFGSDARQRWRTPLPPGHSTPCVCGDFVFLTTYDAASRELAIVALDRAVGTLKWKRVVPFEQLESFHATSSPASSTPACNGRQVFAFFGSYGMICCDLEGNLLWEKRMGPFQDEFGAASSPILLGDRLILNEDHDVDSFLMAMDQATGDIIWKTARTEATRSYSTPVILETADGPQIVVAGSLRLSGYDAASGRPMWWYSGLSRLVDSTPVIANGLIHLATWTPGGDEGERIQMEPYAEAVASYDRNGDSGISQEELPEGSEVNSRFFRIDLNQDKKLDQAEWERHAQVFAQARNVALAIRPGGTGELTGSSVLWTYQRGLPTVPSSIVYDGVFYMVRDTGIVTLLDAGTGELLDQGRAAGRGNYYASLVAGDGKVYLASESGVMTILKAGRTFEIQSSHDFGERIVATPVFSRGAMYLRTDAAVYSFTE